ncbi:MATE family efflux transporter [uncultured Pseudoteredinibacter sp.]|uniref:MATE family efflux transporter n=1 Tax=uncultured Pseudoteredinibacter sp. TaxID=1641701 RepID=UPI00263885E8|nr:MATE family efflux transporter [uncultured Pseudoteredinibacter sp.]
MPAIYSSIDTGPKPATMEATANSKRPSILGLALPSISLFLIFNLVNLAVIKIVATLGTAEVAAVTTGSRIFFIVYAGIMGLSAGATALIAHAWGAGDPKEAALQASLSVKLGIALSIVASALFMWLVPYLADVFQLQGEAKQATIDYVRFSSAFNANFAIIVLITSALRATGDGWVPLYITAVCNALFLPLCAALTFGWPLLNIPELGIRGTALGGGIAYVLGSILTWLLWRRHCLQLPYLSSSIKNDWLAVKKLWHISYPAIAEQLVIQIALFLFLTVVATYSTEAFAAYGVGLGILSITIVIGAGFGVAASALVGQELGAGNPELAIGIGYRTLFWAVLTMTLMGGLTIYYATALASFMVNDPEVIRLTAVFLLMLGISQPLMAVDFALGGALRGAGDTRFPLLSTFCGFLLTRMAVALVFKMLGLSVEWIFGALIADYIVKAILIFYRFYSKVWLRPHLPSS